MALQIVWFKRDLRVHDHAPLANAASAGPFVGLYVYEPELLEADDCDAAHLTFVNQSLIELRANLRKMGSDLLLRTGQTLDVFQQIHDQFVIARIWSHEETFNDISYRRDRRVRLWCKENRVPIKEIPQYGVVRRLKDRDGWAKESQRRMQTPITKAPTSIAVPNELDGIQRGEIQSPDQFRMHSFERETVQTGGESLAAECLDSFLQSRGNRYRSEMSSPLTAWESCSRLSTYIAYGNISMRSIHHHVAERIDDLKVMRKSGVDIGPTWLKSLSSYRSRLSWHCHFMQKLEDEPSIEFKNVNRAYDGLREDDFNEQYFSAWCRGQTGYPMIDACMRALHKTGWINFRMRAMLVSFSSYHLWLHWRRPALYLARLFLDYEPGIHYSQIQMQSGVTGINTIRIYSPIKQAMDQDPHGTFIRQHIPELADVPDKHIAEPQKMNAMEQTLFRCRINEDYPAPIVDHATAYKQARDRMHELKRRSSTRQESAKVYQKHGSRKTPLNRRVR